MARTIAEALIAEGEKHGILKEARAYLRFVLEKQFGRLSKAVVMRIDAPEDIDRIHELGL